MDEQIPPQQPIDATVVPEKNSPNGKTKRLRGFLESLPPEIKSDMETHMRTVTPGATRKYMIDKYGKDYPAFESISKAGFKAYFNRNKAQILKELELREQCAAATPEAIGVVNAITDPNVSLSDKRAALTALWLASEARLQVMMQRQTNFLDPYIEKLMLDSRKEQHSLVKTIADLNEQLSKEAANDYLKNLGPYTSTILSAVMNTYRIVHQADLTKFSEFKSALSENLSNVLKAYTTNETNNVSDKA